MWPTCKRSPWNLYQVSSDAHKPGYQMTQLTSSFYSLSYEHLVTAQCSYPAHRQLACWDTKTHLLLYSRVTQCLALPSLFLICHRCYYGWVHSHTLQGKLVSVEQLGHLCPVHIHLLDVAFTICIAPLSSLLRL
jgi:hypothetical protein